MKEGEIVVLDSGRKNGGPVRLVKLRQFYARVKDEQTGEEWDVMKFRLDSFDEKYKQSKQYKELLFQGQNMHPDINHPDR